MQCNKERPPVNADRSSIKQDIQMSGHWFNGPFKYGVDELPADAGVCLVCTESGYGIKVMSIEDTTNIKDCIKKSKRRACWERVAEKDIIDIYIAVIDNKNERAKVADAVRSRRKYKLECEENF